MAGLKISELTAASTPLAGTEVLPIVQSNATKQVTVANLTAGRAVATGALTVTGDATLSTGNIVPSTAAKGINFTANTPAAGMTSQLLNWYEEGTWTPGYTGWTINPTLAAGQYTRIGRTVTITMLGIGGTTTIGAITGLPFTSKSTQGATATIRGTNSNTNAVGSIFDSSSEISNIGTMTAGGNYWTLSVTYIV